jgi:CRISPR-associated endonuclease/helicase Cas3
MDHLYSFWGKAERGRPSHHPAVLHMIDSGIVARHLLDSMPECFQGRFYSEFTDHRGPQVQQLIPFLVSLHDLGKIGPGFQGKRADLFEPLRSLGFTPPKVIDETRHGQVLLDVLPDLLTQEMECPEDAALAITRVLSAHHGAFLSAPEALSGSGLWADARKSVVSFLSHTLGVETLSGICIPSTPGLMIFAGLISVADWLASAEEYFPYLNGPPQDIREYIADRNNRAKRVIAELRFQSPKITQKGFADLFGFPHPNPCQATTLRVAENLQHPFLLVVESPMGTGKTEASQATYARIASRDGLRGMYYGLPTQATGNAMLPRMKNFLERLGEGTGTELHLLHANADLNPLYESLRMAAFNGQEEDVIASSWFTARKRGLLAPYGVGTIDQALLAALKVRHFFVRLFGLAGKLIVFDEVHAYDAYMVEEIYRLIGWLAHCHTSIVLLSATLPKARRSLLVHSFHPGAVMRQEVHYPCVVGVDTTGNIQGETIESIEEDTINIIPVISAPADKFSNVAAILSEKLVDGGCAACVMNTVGEAQGLYEKVKRGMPDFQVILFHSRFTLERKLKIEEDLLFRYGKTARWREKGIVIATQVVEQSLDVDFDLMISDIAPIDLLLQRSGRLHRHRRSRPGPLRDRNLYVIMPDLTTGFPDFGPSRWVYARDILLRTGLLFFKEGRYQSRNIIVPSGISSFIETVYCEDDSQIPSHLAKAAKEWANERLGTQMAETYAARADALMKAGDCLHDPDYFGVLSNDFDDERVIVTRITRPNVTLIVLEEGMSFETRSREATRSLYARSVTTDHPRTVEYFRSQPVPVEWQESPLLRNCRPLFVRKGVAIDKSGLTYEDEIGLRIGSPKRR